MAATAPVGAAVVPSGTENQPPSGYAPYRDNLNIRLICPHCKLDPPDLVEDNADTICAMCGTVLAERLVSYESEWRTFNSDEKGGDDPSRVGETENDLLFGNAGTTIGGRGANMSKETRRLQRAQAMQNEDKNNRALMQAYSILDGWADAESFNGNVKSQAKGFYKQVYEAQAFRGKNINAILAGCLFIACRSSRDPRSFAEIVNLTKVQKKDIGRIYKQLEKFFGSKSSERMKAIEEDGGIVNREALEYKGTVSAKPTELVPRFCGMLGLEFRVQAIGVKLAEQIPSISALAGRSPLSTAGACIYFASHLLGRGKSYAEIGSVINVSEATIKHAYKLLLQERDRLIEQDWLGKQPVTHKERKGPLVGKISNLPSS